MIKRTEKRICDICGKEAATEFYQFKVKCFFRKWFGYIWLPDDLPATWDICGDCLEEIKTKRKEREEE